MKADASLEPGPLFAQGIAIPDDFGTVPETLNMVGETLDRPLAAGWADRIAFVGPQGQITYAELNDRVGAFAAHCSRLGIARGERVLLRMWNSAEFVTALLGLLKIGAVPVMQNSTTGPSDVEYVQEHSDAVAAIALNELADPLRKIKSRLSKGLIVARGAESGEAEFEAMTRLEAGMRAAETLATRAEDPALMCYTSGTTGRPKGIVHAHRWILGRGIPNRMRVPPVDGDVVMASGEWSFISLLGHNVLFSLRNGVTGAILEGRATPERVLESIEKYKVSVLYAVPTIYRMILAKPGIEDNYDLSSLRGCNASGEALGAAALAEWRERIGVDIWEHYGVSEMQMVIGHSPLLPIKPGSVGVPWGVEARIIDVDDNVLPRGQAGQLVFRTANNPSLFLGYHKDADKTAEVTQGGWLRTGDLALEDSDGYFWIMGRNDDCFKSKGVFIAPIEIENALLEHDDVAEACVVPLPDGSGGNLIRAVVVARNHDRPQAGLADELKHLVRERVARNKAPHVFDFVESLPKSSNNKILRRELPPHVPSAS